MLKASSSIISASQIATPINVNLVMGNGFGIDFSATSGTGTSELLNDYEEGTWTPEYDAFTGAFTSLTYTTQLGVYTKIGRTVICSFNIVVNAVTTGTAATLLLLKGFPFAFSTDGLANARIGGSVGFFLGWTTNAPTRFSYAGFSDKLGMTFSSATDISNLPPANVTASCQFQGIVIYQI